jgi:hypothetical protein
MAEKLERAPEIGMLHERAAVLRSSVEAGWNATTSLYCYRDRLTEQPSESKLILSHKGSGEMRPKKAEFEQPVRLFIEIQTGQPGARRPTIEIGGLGNVKNVEPAEGTAEARQSERIEEDQFQWRAGGLTAISEKVYCKVRHIVVSGLEETDQLVVRTVDATAQDITLFTPLWAHIPDEARAESLLRGALLDAERFNRPFGIRALAASPDSEAETVTTSVHLLWNQLIGEGLLGYGYRAEAARLTEKLMQAVIQCLKQSHAFYERYNAEMGSGIGERGALRGLAPVGLFLQALGVNILSSGRVRLEGKNPFAWPVTILYKGLKVVRGLDETEVLFPNGQSVTVSEEDACVVSM